MIPEGLWCHLRRAGAHCAAVIQTLVVRIARYAACGTSGRRAARPFRQHSMRWSFIIT